MGRTSDHGRTIPVVRTGSSGDPRSEGRIQRQSRRSGLTGIVAVVPVTPRVLADPEDLGDEIAALIVGRLPIAASRSAGSCSAAPAAVVRVDHLRAPGPAVRRRAAGPERPGHRDDGRVRGAEPTGGFPRSIPTLPHSCRRFGRAEIVGPPQRVAAASAPAAYRRPTEISGSRTRPTRTSTTSGSPTAGGIDLFLLASGAGDGHIAFNPPGTDADARTRVVALPDVDPARQPGTFPTLRRRARRGAPLRGDRRRRAPSGSAPPRCVMIGARRGQDRGRAAAGRPPTALPTRLAGDRAGRRRQCSEPAPAHRSTVQRRASRTFGSTAASPPTDPLRKAHPWLASRLAYVGGGSSRAAGTMASLPGARQGVRRLARRA